MKKHHVVSALLSLTLLLSPTLGLTADPKGRPAATTPPPASAPAAPKLPAGTGRPATPRPPAKRSAVRQTPATAEGQTATLLADGRWLVAGGDAQGGPQSSVLITDAEGRKSRKLRNALRHPRLWHTATLLADGRVLIYGGVGAGNRATASAELFSPETGESELLPAAGLTPRAEHTATLLTDGQVLIAGGVSEDGRGVGQLALWDAQTKSAATLPATFKTSRRRHAATLMPDGNVLIWGGRDDDNNRLDDGELYETERQGLSWSGARQAREDDKAPYLVFSAPRDGEASVPRGVRVALRFSKPLRVETFNADTVTLVGQEGQVAARVVAAEGGMLGFVTPRAELRVGASYTLSLNGPTDALEQRLAPSTVTFTTVRPADEEHVNEHLHNHEGDHTGETPAPTPTPSATPSATPRADEDADDEWKPNPQNPYADWRSNRPESPWQKLPPLQAPDGVTALSGQVLKLNGLPLARVTLQIGERAVRTDGTGRFLLTGIPAGHQEMLVNGHTASRPGRTYAMCENAVEVVAGRTSVLPYTIWLPVIDTTNVVPVPVPTTRDVVVTSPHIPGLEVHVPAGVRLRNHHGEYVTSMGLTAIPVDRTPVPLPDGARFFFTPQSHGAEIEPTDGDQTKGFRVVYPNVGNLPPGASVNLMGYDPHRPGGWYVYGKGSVTRDGRQIAPDPGVVLKKLNCYGGFFDSDAPPGGPPPGGGAFDGDPVDLSTGLFVYEKVDLALPDTLPISLRRTYRPGDNVQRPFGVGATHPYEMKIVGDNGSTTPQQADLILPDGGRIHYVRTNNGSTPYTFEHTATPTRFYKSTLIAVARGQIGGWDIHLRDGTTLQFQKWHRGMWIHSVDVRLVGIRDRHGNTVQVQRDDQMRVHRIISPNNRWVEFSYDPAYSSRISQARDNIGRNVNYVYDAGGRLWKVTDVNEGVTEYTYTGDRMETIKDPRGITFLRNQYDANGRVFKQTQADNTTYQFAYTLDLNGKIVQTDVTDPRNNVRRVTFNAAGYPLTDTYPVGKIEQQTYTYEREPVTNKVTRVTDPLGRKTKYTLDAEGRLTGVTRLAETVSAATTQFTYEPQYGQVATVTDALQKTTSFVYDTKGNLTSVTDPLDLTYTFTYNAAGQILTAADPLQHTTRFTYERGEMVEARDPLNRTRTRFADDAGRTVSVTDPLGHTTRYEYDAYNQVMKVKDAAGGNASFTYDPNGNLLSFTDARGKVTGYSYNNMDRLETRTDSLQGASSVVHYEYDAAGNLKKLTDRRGKVTTYTYDNLHRLSFVGFGTTGIVPSYESSISYTYDPSGRITQATDSSSGTITRSYDDLARTWEETMPQGTVAYAYDKAGRLTGKTVTGQQPVSYTYDDGGRLTTITQGSNNVAFGYDDASRRTSLTLPNGVVVAYGYDAASQLTGLTYSKGATQLGDLTYEHDAAGRRTKIGGSFARSLMPQPLASSAHNDANRLVQRGSQALTYDANGNLTSDGANTYTWDARNQLIAVGGSLGASFQYDAFGRRTSKSVNGQTTSYLYDGANVAREQTGGTTANLLSGGVDEVFLRADAAGARVPLHGSSHSTLALTDAAGALKTQYTYDPFGGTAAQGEPSANAGQYTGRENDATGLYYYRARYYSPTLQRFISEDPSGMFGGTNLYAYVGNGPVGRLDPSGLDFIDDFLTHASNISAGFGDTISGGLTAWIRGFTPGRKAVDEDSWGYFGGELAGHAWELAFAAASGKPPGKGRLGGKPRGGCGPGGCGAGGRSCFVAGTKIQTASGEKRIEDVRAGDTVVSLDPERAGTAGLQRQQVVTTFERVAPVVLDIRVAGETITATPEHPFWVVERGWTPAGLLLPGDRLLTSRGAVVRVESIARREGRFKVYNFEVSGTHTYFVSALGILVHNQCKDFVDLTDAKGRTHILDGDSKGGGHRFGTGNSKKSEFPASWSDDEILHHVSDVATDPASLRTPGHGGRTVVEGTRDGIDIRVILESPAKGGRIVTGFPTNTPRNP